MRQFFIISLFLLLSKPTCVFGQTKNKPELANEKLDSLKSTPCIIAIDSAQRQAKNGIFCYTIMGTLKGDDFQYFYNSYMQKKYNVTIHGSCLGLESEIQACYVVTANNLVEEKFGKDFIDRTIKEAKTLYKK